LGRWWCSKLRCGSRYGKSPACEMRLGFLFQATKWLGRIACAELFHHKIKFKPLYFDFMTIRAVFGCF
jgi:hypothetical protein